MTILKKVAIGIAALVALVIVIGMFLPDETVVSRSTLVDAPAVVVFDHVNDLRKAEAWSPWKQADPTMDIDYSDGCIGMGAWYTWMSKHSGRGKLTIVESVPPKLLRTSLDFHEQGSGKGEWTFEESPEGTKTTWTFMTNAEGLMARYMGVFMDVMVGPYFEKGLANLKEVAEATPPPSPATPSEPVPEKEAAPEVPN